MSERTQSLLRKLIQEIRSDQSLSQNEKNKQIQNVMTTHKRVETAPTNASLSARLEPNSNRECKHYVKNCSRFYFSCCDTIDPCHRCHLERGCEAKPPKIATISCNFCGTRQAPKRQCQNPLCNKILSESHCSICMIWTQSEITHCVGCGLCRIGSPESLFHCDTCEACFHVAFKDRHRCMKISMKDQRCPLCLEPTHSSQKR
jgi:RING finger/CHY zinc finger protein 1